MTTQPRSTPDHLASLHRQLHAAVRAAALAWIWVFAVTCVFVGTLVASGPAHAGQERWDKLATPLFQHLGLDQGLPHPVGMALAQDGDGYIWIGTQSGLARWDGYQVRSFSHNAALSTSLPGDFIQTLHVDHAGRLWVGSAAAGLALYDKRKEHFVRPHEELSRGAINAIASDSKGNLWVGTPAALKFYDAAAGTVSSYTHENSPGLPDNQIRALLFDRTGNLWIGTGKGLARLRPGGAIATVPVVTGAEGQWQDAVLALAENRQGQIGFATHKSGVGMADPQRDSARLLALTGVRDMDAHMVLALAEIAPQRWWATTYGGGIVEYHTDGSR
ncbi:MAG: two-component regulator propeller domain-containing protein, partial [Duganella sp.]